MTRAQELQAVADAYTLVLGQHSLPPVAVAQRWITGLRTEDWQTVKAVLAALRPVHGWAVRIGDQSEVLFGPPAFETVSDVRPMLEAECFNDGGVSVGVVADGAGGWRLVEIGDPAHGGASVLEQYEGASSTEVMSFAVHRAALLPDLHHSVRLPALTEDTRFVYDVLWEPSEALGMTRRAAALVEIK